MSSKKYILLGFALVFSQILTMIPAFQKGFSLSANLHGGFNDIIFLAGYFCVGIIGLVLLAIGLIKRSKGK